MLEGPGNVLNPTFLCRSSFLNHLGQIGNGSAPVLDCHACPIAYKVANIHTKIDGQSRQELEAQPKFKKSEDAAIALTKPQKHTRIINSLDSPCACSIIKLQCCFVLSDRWLFSLGCVASV